MGLSNPSNELLREFESQWKDEKIASLISIGAGHEGVIQVGDLASLSNNSPSNSLTTSLKRMATDCERVALCLQDRFRDQHIYFRFSVEQGLQNRTNGEQNRLADIEAHTKAYLQSSKTSDLVEEVVESLSGNLDAPHYTNSTEYFHQTLDRYITNCNQILEEIHIDGVTPTLKNVIALLESIQVSGFNSSAEYLHLTHRRPLRLTSCNGFL